MSSVTISDLFEIHSERLALKWVAGHAGGGRSIRSDESHPAASRKIVGDDISALETRRDHSAGLGSKKSLVGHLNLIHPNQIQVLGSSEVQYMSGLRAISREDAIRQLLSHEPHCIVVADSQVVPKQLDKACEESATPLFTSTLASNKLTDDLHYY
ncbi:MAG: hypothetical protein ACREXT_15500, partial [Gammaproteobacteria bacterium]